MPLVALNTVTGERVNIIDLENPRAVLAKDSVVCPVCNSPMYIRGGTPNLIHHFAHKPGREDCEYAIYSRGETEEHRQAKIAVYQNLSTWFAEYTVAVPAMEVRIPEVKHAHHRIADVLFTFPSGWRVAHEIQLASITPEELQARTEDYAETGIDVFWWFGRDALKQTRVLDWSMNTYGFVLRVRVQQSENETGTVVLKTSVHSNVGSFLNGKQTSVAV